MTGKACRMLALLHQNVRLGVDSLKSAGVFVEGLEGLTPAERLFLESALSNTRRLEEFYARFVLRRKRTRPHSLLHVAKRARSASSRQSGS